MRPSRVRPGGAGARGIARHVHLALVAVVLVAVLVTLLELIGRPVAGRGAAGDQPGPAGHQHDRGQPVRRLPRRDPARRGLQHLPDRRPGRRDRPLPGQLPLVVLAEAPLTAPQAALFAAYVAGGGQLIAMRPDAQLAPTLGLTRVVGGSTADGYVLASPAHPVGAGIAAQTLQFHGVGRPLHPERRDRLATLYAPPRARPAYPAVTLRPVRRRLRRPRSPTTWPARSPTLARATPPPPAPTRRRRRRPHHRRRSWAAGSTSTGSRCPRPTSSSGCSPT